MSNPLLINQFDYLFNPKSIAVVGASNTFGKWGFGIFSQIWSRSKGRQVYPINKKESEVFGIKSYENISETSEN